jgi:hypothetical protein
MIQSTAPTRRRWLTALAIVLALAAAGGTRIALAKIVRNTIDPVATVAEGGRRVTVSGPLEATAGETAYLLVTLTQRSTGAVAHGIAFVTATGARQQWTVQVYTVTREAFAEGPATAVGLARTTAQGRATDAHQWLVNVTLVR